MIYRNIFIALITAVSFFLISARISDNTSVVEAHSALPPFSGGPGNGGLGDRTGSPVSSGTCAACHSGGSFGASVSIQLFDGANPITSYTPGTNYTVVYTVTGSSSAYGFQGGALIASNNNGAGAFSLPSSGTQLATIAGRPYIEHIGASPTGVFQSTWTAPAANSGTVNFYGIGLAVNSNGGTSGDQVSTPVSISITEEIQTTITYQGNPFCGDDANKSPTLTGTTNGTYSSSAGLSINATTGVINVNASTPGTYSINYTYATGVATTSVTINSTFTTSAALTICETETVTFGSQQLNASNAGLNTEVFQSIDGCDSTVNLTLTVDAIDNSTTLAGGTLTANQTGANYQWVDCNNGNAAITGETNATFTPTATTGNYAVVITLNNCTETSTCTQVDVASINEQNINSSVVFPNPVSGVFVIKNLEQFGTIHSISLMDSKGKVVKQISITDSSADIGQLDSGIYFLKIESDSGDSIISVVKK